MPETDAAPTILVVEDNRDVLAVIAHTLSSNGYTVTRAYDGEAGLTTALDTAPALVILDIGLPKRSGLTRPRQLSQFVPSKLKSRLDVPYLRNFHGDFM